MLVSEVRHLGCSPSLNWKLGEKYEMECGLGNDVKSTKLTYWAIRFVEGARSTPICRRA
jgi:hypothetical protein